MTLISPEFSQGVNLFGARRKSETVPTSRDAKNTFSKFNLGFQHKRSLPLNLQTNLKFDSQFAGTMLAPQEEFYLGGIDSVRGYPAGDYLADTAFQTSLELLIPAFFVPEGIKLPYANRPLRDDTTALLFFDYGYGRRKGVTGAGKKAHNLQSAGAGFRVRLFDQALLRLEWGFPFGNEPVTKTAHSEFHFSVDFQDRFREEMDRIRDMMHEEHIRKLAWYLLDEEIKRPGSPLREKLQLGQYINLAQAAYEQGQLEEAKDSYQQVVNIGESLYRQTEDYVRSCYEQHKRLQDYKKLAMKYYSEHNLEKAKEVWNRIIEEARVKPLLLEF